MPTGYTSVIDDNPDITFAEFLWRCVRAHGAFAHMRDSPLTEIPTRPKPSTYHADNLEKAIKKRDEFNATPDAVHQVTLDEEYEADKKLYEKNLFDYLEKAGAYSMMEKEVLAWEIKNPDHQGLKNFMLEQLAAGAPIMHPEDEPVKLELEDWKRIKRDSYQWSVDYHMEGLKNEQERGASLNRLIDDLIESAPPPFEIKENE